jgi:tellurite resistance protein TerC
LITIADMEPIIATVVANSVWLWVGFNVFVLCILALDLGVFHKKSHIVSFKESITWTVVWVTLAMIFNLGIAHYMGKDKALEFFTGYVIEKSLSVDNIFVFALLFTAFAVPPLYQHKILFWGIIGALMMRAGMIALGAALISNFTWIIYVFGIFLILTGIKMLIKSDETYDPKKSIVFKLFRKVMPVTDTYHDDKFLVRQNGILTATPMLMVLVLVEFTDVIFAVDSIPAIFAVTKDPFIVYTSNVFAILGLRSLYFALAGVMDKFHYLKTGLALVLGFVGTKMLLSHSDWKIESNHSLIIIVAILATSVIGSLVIPKKAEQKKQD